MSALDAVKAELAQKERELETLRVEHDAAIVAGRAAESIIRKVAQEIRYLIEAQEALEGRLQ